MVIWSAKGLCFSFANSWADSAGVPAAFGGESLALAAKVLAISHSDNNFMATELITLHFTLKYPR
jgi:hypothetical protein